MNWIAAGLGLALLAVMSVAGSTQAAVTVAVSVSPPEGVVGRPVEVLLRTFAPVGEGVAALPVPSLPYPAASGLWNVLYPIADYPFDVVAKSEDGTPITVQLSRDQNDATLWRGIFTPTTSGDWTVVVRNFPTGEPGASARVSVAPSQDAPLATVVAVVSLVIGVLLGLVLGRATLARGRRTA